MSDDDARTRLRSALIGNCGMSHDGTMIREATEKVMDIAVAVLAPELSSLRARVKALEEGLEPFTHVWGAGSLAPHLDKARSLLSRTLADKGGEDLIQESSSVVSNPPLNPYADEGPKEQSTPGEKANT